MTAPGDWAWLALIRRPQGRKGEVFADLLTDFPERFNERKNLWLVAGDGPAKPAAPALPHAVELTAHWQHKGGIVLHFAGVESISAAEVLAGLAVAIPREQRAALGDGEVYIGDLIGCVLVDVAGAEPAVVGEIEDVDSSAGPVAILVVRGEAERGETVRSETERGGRDQIRKQILVPFAKSFLRRIDLEGRRVEMALPEGLLDLN
jgi:16S rRNA processing protein RimM